MTWKRYGAATTIALLMVLHNATGQASGNPACAIIKDNEQRLECYDNQADATAPTGEKDKDADTGEISGEVSIVEKRLQQESRTSMSKFAITAHKPNYFLPFTYNDNPNTDSYDATAVSGEPLQRVEAKFQLSFKVPLVKRFLVDNAQLWFAYSQLAFWQMYNRDLSSPFRETDYEPELLWSIKTDYQFAGFRSSFITLALNHQSNGRSDPLSRSWNRVKAGFVFEKENLVLSVDPWYRFPEDKEDDDNPDIDAYLGYADFGALYKYKQHLSTILFRNNLRSGNNRSTIELTYTFQFNDRLKGIAQYFNGYGESLIDYNHRVRRFGVGILLTDWL